MPQRFMLTDWLFDAVERTENKDLISGARRHASELRKIDPRRAQELDAAIIRRERELESEARPTAGN